MSEINQPISEARETSPPKITIQHSHTSGFDREIDSGTETQVEVNKDAMVVDEEVHDSEGGSPDVNGTNNFSLEGDDGQDEEMREDEEEHQSLFHDGHVGEDDEDLEEEDNNDEGNKDDNIKTNKGQPQGPTTTTPTADVNPERIKASTRTTGGSFFRRTSSPEATSTSRVSESHAE